jgi:hypothetical protein
MKRRGRPAPPPRPRWLPFGATSERLTAARQTPAPDVRSGCQLGASGDARLSPEQRCFRPRRVPAAARFRPGWSGRETRRDPAARVAMLHSAAVTAAVSHRNESIADARRSGWSSCVNAFGSALSSSRALGIASARGSAFRSLKMRCSSARRGAWGGRSRGIVRAPRASEAAMVRTNSIASPRFDGRVGGGADRV